LVVVGIRGEDFLVWVAGALEVLGARVVAGGLLADDGAEVCIVEVGAGVDVVGVAAAWVAALWCLRR
jgi:hypothetical protein